MNKQICAAAIHDISCFGRCSLTVALPVLSAAGIHTSILPTAVLSTHTGGLEGYTFRDLTEDMAPIANHWANLGLRFDAVYTGYLGSVAQVELVAGIIEQMKAQNPNLLVIVDPVMGDEGEPYSLFTPQFPQKMHRLCRLADVLVPNITEAALLVGMPYQNGPHDKAYITQLVQGLATLTSGKIVLTGVFFNKQELGSACFDPAKGQIEYSMGHRVEGMFPGTGDVFASALTAALLNGCSLIHGAKIAADFTVESICRTVAAGTDPRYGVNFEMGLARLANRIQGENDGKDIH